MKWKQIPIVPLTLNLKTLIRPALIRPASDSEDLDLESSGAEALDFNQLHDLGNQAIAQGLIIGHGYHQGKYELLHRGEALLLSPPEALSYLRSLMPSAEQTDG